MFDSGTLSIEGGSFFSDDGMPYTGIVKASLAIIDTSDPSSVDFAPSDFTTVDISTGEEMGMSSYGMLGMSFTDDQGGEVGNTII